MSESRPGIRESGRQLGIISLAALTLLAIILPWELENPWLRIWSLEITNVELWQGVVIGLASIQWFVSGRPALKIPRIWLWLGGIFLGVLIISSAAAPAFRINAITAMMRTFSGIGLMLATVVIVRSKRDLKIIAAALVIGAILASSAGLLEFIRGYELAWLMPFRSKVTLSGPFLRLTGPFDYANQAAMYVEAAIPLLAGFFWMAWRKGKTGLAILHGLGILLLFQSALSTYSRSALLILLLFLIGALVIMWRLGKEQGLSAITLPASFSSLAMILLLANVLANPIFGLRLSTEGDVEWYSAELQVPAEMTFSAGEQKMVTVAVRNDGAFTWRSEGSVPVLLAARWIHPESKQEFARQIRWPLPSAVAPGESSTMEVPLRAPGAAGEFKLVWDLVQEGVAWFGIKTGRETSSTVIVEGETPLFDADGTSQLYGEILVDERQNAAPIPGRLTLWKAAWLLWQQRPLLGIGLDNFRLRYGEVLGYALWNKTIHSNNWYIETGVSVGLLGAIPFILWLAAIFLDMVRRVSHAVPWEMALMAAILAFFIHGILDYFLLFNATGLLFWVLVGLWVVARYHLENRDAQLL